MKKKNSFQKRAKKALLTATAATSFFVNNAYDNPLEIIDDNYSDSSLQEDQLSQKESSLKRSFRRLLGQIPLPIRAIVFVPFWFMGAAIMLIVNPLIDYIIIPNINLICNWLIVFALVLAITILATIFIFPNLPLAKFLNKKVLLLILFLVLGCAIADKIASIYYQDYRNIKLVIKLGAILLISIIALIQIYYLNRKLKINIFTDHYHFKGEF